MAPSVSQTHHIGMKTKLSYLTLLLTLLAQLWFASGCANTAKGVQKDYQHAEDKVENATH